MVNLTISIEGFDPLEEIKEPLNHYGPYPGEAFKAVKGLMEWWFIWTGNEVRRPTELEQYLFNNTKVK